LMVQFSDESLGNPTTWEWDFNNDGMIDSYVQNPQWEYNQMGYYSVRLEISDSQNNSSKVKSNFIRVDYIEKPVLSSVVDVPNDQGGKVQIVWRRCLYDKNDTTVPITLYSVWRYDDIFRTSDEMMLVLYAPPDGSRTLFF